MVHLGGFKFDTSSLQFPCLRKDSANYHDLHCASTSAVPDKRPFITFQSTHRIICELLNESSVTRKWIVDGYSNNHSGNEIDPAVLPFAIECGRDDQAIAVGEEEADLTRDMIRCDDDHVLSATRAVIKQQANVAAYTATSRKRMFDCNADRYRAREPSGMTRSQPTRLGMGSCIPSRPSSFSLSHKFPETE